MVLNQSRAAHDGCVDETTEILTKRGWLTYDQICPWSDEALAIDPSTGMASWQVIEYVFHAERQREMILMQGDRHSSLTTPDHRWLSIPLKKYGRQPRWKTTETLSQTDRIPTTASVIDLPQEHSRSDDFVELMAWYWTEGWTVRRGEQFSGGIGQSSTANPQTTERIRALLTRMYGPARPRRYQDDERWSESLRGDGVVTFWLSAPILRRLEEAAPAKIMSPTFLLSLTQTQLDLLIQVSIDADGWRNRHKRSSGVGEQILTQKSQPRLDAFLMACALAGYATGLGCDRGKIGMI